LSAGIPDKLACRVLRVGAADQDAAVDRREQARARRVDVSAGASGRRVMDEDVLGERIRSQSEDLARAFVGYRKAFQSASSKDSDVHQSTGNKRETGRCFINAASPLSPVQPIRQR
jgi:hypothetical protein